MCGEECRAAPDGPRSGGAGTAEGAGAGRNYGDGVGMGNKARSGYGDGAGSSFVPFKDYV